ncbi:MAG: HD domain-containing protein [Clostridia bacterium]|nr:HD domain-containing protein [Clostridia bacterium]
MTKNNAKLDILKYLLAIAFLIFIVFQYMKTYDQTYLVILGLFVLFFAVFELTFKKRHQSLIKEQKEIEELKQKILKQKEEIESIRKQSLSVSEELKNTFLSLDDAKSALMVRDEELNALRYASEIITSTFDAETITEYIYKVFNKFTGCDRYLITYYDKEMKCLVCKYEYGNITFSSVGKPFEDKSVKTCFDSRNTVVIKNVLLESREIKGDKIAIPLNVSEALVGVIYIECGVPGTFRNINIEFLESLAIYTAIAIKNAELFNSTCMQKQEIEALYEETAAVNEELSSYIYELNRTKEELKQKNEELTKFYDEIQTGYLQTVMALANSIEAKDPYTRGHCQRVMEISCEIAQSLGYSESEIEDLRYAAILHDIGKIGVPANILNKQGKLTDEEFGEIKKHPLIAYNILKDVQFIKNGLDAILQHHERYDGKGYPYNISGEEICMFGRILCVADAFDAMTSDRPYRKGMKMEDAVREIERCKGTQFDPDIVDIFIRMIGDEKSAEGDMNVGQ